MTCRRRCCEDEPCVGCECSSESSVQLDAIYSDGTCADCNTFNTVSVPKVTAFTTLSFGDTCKASTCGDPCLIDGLTAPICFYQSDEELPCDDDRPTTLYFRVSIHQSILDPTLLVVMVSIVLFRPDFFGFDGDLQARTGCATWDGTCDTIDLDVDLDEVCIEGTETPACVLPDTVTVTVL